MRLFLFLVFFFFFLNHVDNSENGGDSVTLQWLLSKFQSDFPGKLCTSWDLHSTVAGSGVMHQLLPGEYILSMKSMLCAPQSCDSCGVLGVDTASPRL